MIQETKQSGAKHRVWLITGAARGLGRSFTEAALASGDKVMGIARDVSPLEELIAKYKGNLVTCSVDISEREAVFNAVEQAIEIFGRLDIVINNAGQLLFGMLEEVTERQARTHMDVNFFGALWVCQAVVPHMRKQGSGHMLQVTTLASGTGGAAASVGMYAAGKAALDAISKALAMEVEKFGIKVTILQPGGYVTGLFTRGTTVTQQNPAYVRLREELAKLWVESYEAQPEQAAPVVLEVTNMDQPPKRLIMGGVAFDQVLQLIEAQKDEYFQYESLSRKAD